MTNEAYFFAGANITYLATAEQTEGSFDAFDFLVAPEAAVPPHRHSVEDEVFFVQIGTFEFMVNGSTSAVEAGGFVRVQAGAVHSFRNAGKTAGRLTVLTFPAVGHAGFFRELGTPIAPFAQDFPDVPGPSFEQVIAAAKRWGMALAEQAARPLIRKALQCPSPWFSVP